ncbi:MAG: TMEM14 family protein [Parachlamydiales bacterium]|nr:TMEM14 family protein [Parachlamydiales bacterium]
MIKKTTSWTVLIYGLLIVSLGYLGYAKGGSSVSLYMGVGFGSLLILSALLMFFHIRFGAYAALFLTLALTATFGIRYSITQKQVPAILAVLSGGMLLFLLTRVVRWRK